MPQQPASPDSPDTGLARAESVPPVHIGPDADPTALLDKARLEAQRQQEADRIGAQVARRLIVAFVLIVLTAGLCFVLFPIWGLRLPAWVPLIAFVAILAGAILTAQPESTDKPDPDDDECTDDGCAVGMCPGPRPMRRFRKDTD